MATATIPVDLTNPGQVFACLGFMEAAEILCGPCTGRFGYESSETQTAFTLDAEGSGDPTAAVVGFLARAEAKAIAPHGSDLSTEKWGVETITSPNATDNDVAGDNALGTEFPCPVPDSPAALPIILSDDADAIPVGHWADNLDKSGRDNVKLWAGMSGKPGAAVFAEMLRPVAALGGNMMSTIAQDPFSFSEPLSSGLRLDWRRDYIALDAGFSPNDHKASMRMVGYPLVELLAAIGLEHARPNRPDRRDKLAYRYGVSNVALPTVFARALLGAQGLGFPCRTFRIRLGWPGQENQARCIIDAQEEFAQ